MLYSFVYFNQSDLSTRRGIYGANFTIEVRQELLRSLIFNVQHYNFKISIILITTLTWSLCLVRTFFN